MLSQKTLSFPMPLLIGLRRSSVFNRAAASISAILITVFYAGKSLAADPDANFVFHLFTDACLPNIGNSAGVRALAEQHRLTPVLDQKWLDMFVGSGDGAAWLLSAREQKFALSIRGMSHACAVWAPKADPDDVESGFRALVDAIGKAAHAEPQIIRDETAATPAGEAHKLIFGITRPGAKGELLLTLLAARHPNPAFQVSLQEALATNHP